MPQIGVAPYNQIAIVNKSTACNDTDGTNMVAALNILLPQFCRDWTLPPVTAVYVAKNKTTTIPLQCILFDTADVAGALGYHDETINGVPYAKVFVKTTLQYGGAILLSANPSVPTVASVVAHEVFEMMVDLHANIWWMRSDYSTLFAAEVCDPVESNIVVVQVPNGGPRVGLSDWILPAWSDPFAKSGPYNHMNTLRAPLTVDRNGYAIVLSNGKISYVFGATRPESAKDPKNLCSRIMTREKRGRKEAADASDPKLIKSYGFAKPAPTQGPVVQPHVALMNVITGKGPRPMRAAAPPSIAPKPPAPRAQSPLMPRALTGPRPIAPPALLAKMQVPPPTAPKAAAVPVAPAAPPK